MLAMNLWLKGIIGFVIWSIVALFFLGIGISCRKSTEAVGFFTGVKAPEVTDVKGYNRAVSTLWFVVALWRIRQKSHTKREK